MSDEATVAASIEEILAKAEAAHGAWATYQDGRDDDWAHFYAKFIVTTSPIATVIGSSPGHDQTLVALRDLARAYRATATSETWLSWYASRFRAGAVRCRTRLRAAARN